MAGDHRRQFVDDRLIIAAAFQRLGQRVVSPGAFGILRDYPAGRRFGGIRVAEAALGLRQQVQDPGGIIRPCGDQLVENVARFGEVVAAAGVDQRRRVPGAQFGVARRPLERTGIGLRRFLPAALAFVKVAERRQQPRIVGGVFLEPGNRFAGATGGRIRLRQQHRTVLPPWLLVDERRQQRDGLVVLTGCHVQSRQSRAHIRIGFCALPGDRLFQVLDRLGCIVAAALALGHRRVDDSENTVGFAVLRRDLQRQFGRRDGFLNFVLSQVQRGQLAGDFRGRRVQLHGPLVGGNGTRFVVVFVEVMPEKELRVRFRNLIRLLRLSVRNCRRRCGRYSKKSGENSDLHIPRIVPQKGGGVI